jgi:hypothetical protein
MLNGKFQSFVYKKAFILTSGLEFSSDINDQRRHITNLSVNKHFSHHPGQITCDLSIEYPEIFEKIQFLWSSLCLAAKPFMIYQENEKNFEFFGFDIIADENGNCWLIEVNRLPGLESSKNNLIEEDHMYNEMMLSILKIILFPFFEKKVSFYLETSEDGQKSEAVAESNKIQELKEHYSHLDSGSWTEVTNLAVTDIESEESIISSSSSSSNYKNLLKWKLFTRTHRKDILAIHH